MHLGILDNVSQRLLPILTTAIERSKEVRIAVAFVSRRGFSMVEPSIRSSLQAGGHVEFLVGLDLSMTEPEALWSLYKFYQHGANLRLYCYSDTSVSGIYHPKLYVMNTGRDTVAIVGSSNLTTGGLKHNVEVNAVIEAPTDDEVISDIYDAYNRLKFDPHRVEPDEELLAMYQKLCHAQRKQERSTKSSEPLRGFISDFTEKVKTLRHPQPALGDLFGWQKLVYSRLPPGVFRNNDVYAFEEDFHQRYPENRNIRAKVRQQLQVLRDIGLLEHLGAGHWRKAIPKIDNT